ncbi:MAG TPA: lysozyme inhibitor LprI family protein [Pyrinomonadaceae bacterium]|jgi:uncharacterized protein YecT (DUF1311 family)|nr:lysozyme inhibitor LprI family protein [Pyrinomonadaceae bacterium]
MIRKLFPLLLLLLLLPALALAQQETVYPIDKALEACTDKNPSTNGTIQCTARAQEMWDKELNRNYNSLMGQLNPQGKLSLKAAQLDWLKYRDTEFKLIDNLYSNLQGTMYLPMLAWDQMSVVKKRALELKAYLDLLKEGRD